MKNRDTHALHLGAFVLVVLLCLLSVSSCPPPPDDELEGTEAICDFVCYAPDDSEDMSKCHFMCAMPQTEMACTCAYECGAGECEFECEDCDFATY